MHTFDLYALCDLFDQSHRLFNKKASSPSLGIQTRAVAATDDRLRRQYFLRNGKELSEFFHTIETCT